MFVELVTIVVPFNPFITNPPINTRKMLPNCLYLSVPVPIHILMRILMDILLIHL